MAKFTVVGGKGFIGSEFVSELKKEGHEVFVPRKNDKDLYKKELGTVIFSAGYGDCTQDIYKVLDINTNLLNEIINNSNFDKMVYISSTRVYMNGASTSESSDVKVCLSDSRKMFNLSKLASEAICMASSKDVLIIRPSNVYGTAIKSNLFLPSIIRDALTDSCINMYIEKCYEKDYVNVKDVVTSTLELLKKDLPSKEIVNIASGVNTTALEISELLEEKTGCKVNWHELDFPREQFIPIDISKVVNLIDYKPSSMLYDLSSMVDSFEACISKV